LVNLDGDSGSESDEKREAPFFNYLLKSKLVTQGPADKFAALALRSARIYSRNIPVENGTYDHVY